MRQEWVCTPWHIPLISSPMAAWGVDFQLIISETLLRKETWTCSGSLHMMISSPCQFVQDFFHQQSPTNSDNWFQEYQNTAKSWTQILLSPSPTLPIFSHKRSCTAIDLARIHRNSAVYRFLWSFSFLFLRRSMGRIKQELGSFILGISTRMLRGSHATIIPNLDCCFGVVIGSSRNSCLNSIKFNLDVILQCTGHFGTHQTHCLLLFLLLA